MESNRSRGTFSDSAFHPESEDQAARDRRAAPRGCPRRSGGIFRFRHREIGRAFSSTGFSLWVSNPCRHETHRLKPVLLELASAFSIVPDYGVLQVGAVQLDVGQIDFAEAGQGQVRAGKIRAAKICLTQYRSPQNRFVQFRGAQISAKQFRAAQIGFAQVRAFELGFRKIAISQIRLAQVRAAQIRVAELGSAQVGFPQVASRPGWRRSNRASSNPRRKGRRRKDRRARRPDALYGISRARPECPSASCLCVEWSPPSLPAGALPGNRAGGPIALRSNGFE